MKKRRSKSWNGRPVRNEGKNKRQTCLHYFFARVGQTYKEYVGEDYSVEDEPQDEVQQQDMFGARKKKAVRLQDKQTVYCLEALTSSKASKR
jgi:hypothetical protein